MTTEPTASRMKGRVLVCAIWTLLLLFFQFLWLSTNEGWLEGWTGTGVFPYISILIAWGLFEFQSPISTALGLIGVVALFLLSAGMAYASAVNDRSRARFFPAILALMLVVATLSWLPKLSIILASPFRIPLLWLLASNFLFFALAAGLHVLARRRNSSALSLAAGVAALTWMFTTMTAPLDPSSGWD